MEIPNGNKFMIAAVFMEFFGVIGYSLAVNMNGGTNIVALVLFVMIINTQSISGGHLNPALTLGVYLERNSYLKNACWTLSIFIAQVGGAFFALLIGYLLRVTMPVPGVDNQYYFVPGQNPFVP